MEVIYATIIVVVERAAWGEKKKVVVNFRKNARCTLIRIFLIGPRDKRKEGDVVIKCGCVAQLRELPKEHPL